MRSCALCHSVHSKRFLAATSWNNAYGIELRKCLACGFVFSAQAEFSYEEFFVDAFVGKDKDELLRVARAQGLHTVVAKIAAKTGLRRGARVMDFGAGIGLAALSFMEFGFDVCAVEESRRYLERHPALGVTSFPSLGEAASAGEGGGVGVCSSSLELEQCAQRIHLYAIDVLDLVLFIFGADSNLPEVERGADAVERVGTGLAR